MHKGIEVQFSVKSFDDATGTVEGYGSVFGNVDLGGDVIERGAFADVLAEYRRDGKSIPMLWAHRHDKIVGVWNDYQEDERGLKLRGRIIEETAQGKEAAILIRNRALHGLSIGYSLSADGYSDDHKTGIRTIRKIARLHEVSLVAVPMNPAAEVTGMKSSDIEQMTEREIERLLRDAPDLSNRVIKAAIARLMDLGAQRDAAERKSVERSIGMAQAILLTLRG